MLRKLVLGSGMALAAVAMAVVPALAYTGTPGTSASTSPTTVAAGGTVTFSAHFLGGAGQAVTFSESGDGAGCTATFSPSLGHDRRQRQRDDHQNVRHGLLGCLHPDCGQRSSERQHHCHGHGVPGGFVTAARNTRAVRVAGGPPDGDWCSSEPRCSASAAVGNPRPSALKTRLQDRGGDGSRPGFFLPSRAAGSASQRISSYQGTLSVASVLRLVFRVAIPPG